MLPCVFLSLLFTEDHPRPNLLHGLSMEKYSSIIDLPRQDGIISQLALYFAELFAARSFGLHE